MQTQKVEIPVNVPIPVTLASLDGVIVDSQFGPGKQQMRFSTAPDGRALYVPTWVGDKIKADGSCSIRLTKKQDAHRKIAWSVEALGEQKDGTFAIPKEKPGSSWPPPPSLPLEPGLVQPNKSAIHLPIDTRTISDPISARKRRLWNDGRELIDAHAALLKYANEKHPGSLTSFDVRTYLVTMFIQAGGRR